MHDDPAQYISKIELALIASEVIDAYTLITQWANTDDGYIRVRATLVNGDFFEASVYFIIYEDQILIKDYRYQWMDSTKKVLHRRWDNTPHYPSISNFPHHCHFEREDNVIPSEPLTLFQVLALLEESVLP